MPIAPRPHCRDCKTGYVFKGGLCADCHANKYPPRYRAMAARVVQAHVRAHGWRCPGWQRGPHGVIPGQLTCDHKIPIARGGTHSPGNLGVLCRSCNSAKQAFGSAPLLRPKSGFHPHSGN